MNILVTGATGFLGNVFIPLLLDSKLAGPADFIRIFALPGESIPEAFRGKVEVARGDLRDPEAVRRAVAGANLVFHLAGYISYRARDKELLFAVNRDGAANVARAAAEAGASRLVHVSSVGAIGFYPDERLADEDTEFNWPETFHYMVSKRAGQDAVFAIGRETGLPVVAVNPASIMGPGDPRASSPMNQLFALLMRKNIFVGTFAGGLAVVDVRDLSALLISAALKGVPGRNYLAVGANVPYTRVLELMTQFAGKKHLPLVAPPRALKAAGAVLERFADITGIDPLLTESYGALSGWTAYYSAQRSVDELGATYRDLETTVAESIEFYRRRFMQKA